MEEARLRRREASQLRRRRLLHEHPFLRVTISFKSALTPQVRLVSFRCLLEHILYVRGQIPAPVTTLRQWTMPPLDTDSSSTAQRKQKGTLLRTQRRVKKFLSNLDTLYDSLPSILRQGDMRMACILLGGSIAMPREVFFVSFHPSSEAETLLDQDKLQLVQRRILRTVIQTAENLTEDTFRTKAHLLFGTPLGSQVTGCTLKPCFSLDKLKLKGTAPTIHHFAIVQTDTKTGEEEGEEMETELSWHAWHSPLQGLQC